MPQLGHDLISISESFLSDYFKNSALYFFYSQVSQESSKRREKTKKRKSVTLFLRLLGHPVPTPFFYKSLPKYSSFFGWISTARERSLKF